MFFDLIAKIFGTKTERDVRRLRPMVERINEHFAGYAALSDDELRGKTEEFRRRLAEGETVDDLLPEAFAVVKETCRRLAGTAWDVAGVRTEWNMIPYDVQLMGAVVLHEGKIAEMATGEGKTLVATLPLYLNALAGKGAHLITVNDYLALRDSEWMGRIFSFLGLTVGCIQHDMDPEARKEQYNRDITYGTNNEFGFDYLRDNMSTHKEHRVQRGFHYAIVDEVDSVLIDEARTPLIISGPVPHSTHKFDEVKQLVARLVRHQVELVNDMVREGEKAIASEDEEERYRGGIRLLQAQRGAPKNKKLLKLLQEQGVQKLIRRVETDFMRDKKLSEVDEDLFFAIDEKNHNIDLTEKGRQQLSPDDPDLFLIPDLPTLITEIDLNEGMSPSEKTAAKDQAQKVFLERNEKISNIRALLKAHSLFEKDVEYVVQEGKVVIVDEFTGRLMPGRRFSEGLHQALEAKEGVAIERETQTLATITLQNFFRLYEKLAGMTGTAETEAGEFFEIYKLDVVVIPTNVPVIRDDGQDQIFRTRREKLSAIVNDIADCYKRGQPVLVGTVSVEASETISRILKRMSVPHSVLNAKNHQGEAQIVSRAGEVRSVTIATNMAGRGTDIKLGPGVTDLGGLRIVGTERHESRRIDRQLRGRAGRQGDPGSTLFYLSLEDDLMRLFGSERIAGVMDRLGLEEGEVITHSMVTRAIEKAQKKVEGHNFEIRKHLLKYDDVMNQQREVIYNRRLHVLEAEDLDGEIEETIEEYCTRVLGEHAQGGDYAEDWDVPELQRRLTDVFLGPFDLPIFEEVKPDKEETLDRVIERAKEHFRARKEERLHSLEEEGMPPGLLVEFERYAILSRIDELWREHLYELDGLKGGIGLRAYAQKDPLLEYKSEAFHLFVTLTERIDEEALRLLLRPVRLRADAGRVRRPAAPQPERVRESHESFSALGGLPGEAVPSGAPRPGMRPSGKASPSVRTDPKVGRNEPCPCGSGKKYKQCCGK
ncbi:MAG: preprotein translocase subunit SecA [Candidatus Eisenbacteria bacterium]|nr:preprotein translocase subunit SecA [Candidatus Eisenbacteria bacterium]